MYSIHLGVVKRLVYLFLGEEKQALPKKVEDIFGVKYVLNKASFIKRARKRECAVHRRLRNSNEQKYKQIRIYDLSTRTHTYSYIQIVT